MKTEKLSSTDAFVVYDIDDAPTSVGIVRSAPKILQSGATWLARSVTYTYAFWERQIGGASAGINAAPDARPAAVKAFVEELTPAVSERRLLVDAAKGVDEAELAPLRAVDPRTAALWTTTDGVMLGDELEAIGAVTAAAAALGGLDGKKVAIEGFGPTGLAVARLVEAQGGSVVAVATADGMVATDSTDAAALGEAWAADGQGLVASLGDAQPGWKLYGTAADVLFVGSKAGAMTHQGAEVAKASAVVPIGPVPITTKALAVLRRAGVVYVPDFVALAGPRLCVDTDAATDADTLRTSAETAVGDAWSEISGHADGELLAACAKAEAFLRTWQDTLPFGRPLA
ncbi:MAG: hypothetical protein S0880_30290 [Actinomycetota bacterium]|nr:hypothetical protein [Actinomycetota bacterium]